jgi:hypothetical protein
MIRAERKEETMRHRWSQILLLTPALLAGACDTTFESVSGAWSFTQDQLTTGGWDFRNGSDAVLSGSVLCPVSTDDGEDTGENVLWDCYDHSVTLGEYLPVANDGTPNCLRLEGPGETTWSWTWRGCGSVEDEYEPIPDSVVFQVADRSMVTAKVQQWIDEQAREALVTESGDAYPEGAFAPESSPFRILAGQEVLIYVGLKDPVTGSWSAFERAGATLREDVLSGHAETASGLDPTGLLVTLSEGTEVQITFSLGHDAWTATQTLLAVTEEDVVSLEVLPLYWVRDDDQPYREPVIARAIARDIDGNLIFGVPVEWRPHHTALAVTPGIPLDSVGDENAPLLPGPDYAWITDDCEKPSQQVGDRSAVLEARFNGISATAEMEWLLMDDAYLAEICGDDMDACLDDVDEDWTMPEECTLDDDLTKPEESTRACGCATGGASGVAGLGSVLAAIALLRRRRRV